MGQLIDIKGMKFGQWSVIERHGNRLSIKGGKGQATWLCKCSCGTEKIVSSHEMRSGVSKSCGCHGRSAELKCSICGLISGDLDLFKNDRRLKNGKAGLCIKCGLKATRKTYNRNKKIIKDAKAVPCGDCGKQYPSHVMDFHHNNDNKTLSITRGLLVGEKRLRSEINKCMVLCANCHRLRHPPGEKIRSSHQDKKWFSS